MFVYRLNFFRRKERDDILTVNRGFDGRWPLAVFDGGACEETQPRRQKSKTAEEFFARFFPEKKNNNTARQKRRRRQNEEILVWRPRKEESGVGALEFGANGGRKEKKKKLKNIFFFC